jgi:hypothetical protein
LNWVAAQIEDLGHEPIPWTKPGLFPPSTYTLPQLVEIVRKSGAAVFIFAEDDRVWYRKDSLTQTRDNVLIEYGLFTGVLGLKKAIICQDGQPKTPIDTIGLTYIDVSESNRNRARVELENWIEKLAGSPGGVDAISRSTRDAMTAILALAIGFLRDPDGRGVVRGMCHALEDNRTLRPIACFPLTPDFDVDTPIPCTKAAAKFIRIAEAALTPGIVKKDVLEADRKFWGKDAKHLIRRDIASVVTSPLIGKQGQVLGTVAFDSNLGLDDMKWNQRWVDHILELTARAIVLVPGLQPEN